MKGDAMKYLKGILATTHIDLQNEKMSLYALESLVEQSNNTITKNGRWGIFR